LQNLRERGIAVALLEQALRGYRLRIENGAFWFATDRERERMNRAYRDALTRTRVVFAPPGRGCSTQRLTDAWMHECVVLSPDLAERIRVPQPRLWVNEAHYVRYSWSLDDLVERAKFAIERADDLSDRARVGREYAERWGAPDRQMATVVRSLREIA
jgi:hypothetical protein